MSRGIGTCVLAPLFVWGVAGAGQTPERIETTHHPSGMLDTFGYTRMQTARMSSQRPSTLTKEPAYRNDPLYVTLRFGDAGRPVVVVLDEDDEQAILYLDANGNGDLTDDPLPALREKAVQPEERARLMKVWIHYHFTAQAPAGYTDGSTDTLGLRLMVYGKICRDKNNVPPDLVYWRDYFRTGAATLNGRAYRAAVVDDNSDGRYDSPPDPSRAFKGDTLFIDRDADGRFERALEGYPAGEPFNVDGITYEVAAVTPRGTLVELKRSARHVPPREPARKLEPGTTAPDFDIPGVGRLSSLRGKVVLVDFWATWCIPCLAELPNLKRAYDRYQAAGFEVVSVSIDEKRDAAKLADVVREQRLRWPSVHDTGGTVRKAYHVTAVPATFLIGRDGRLLATELRSGALASALERELGPAAKALRPGGSSRLTVRWLVEDGYYLDEKTTSTLAFSPPPGLTVDPGKVQTSGRVVGVVEQAATLSAAATVEPGTYDLKADAVIFFCSVREQWCKRVTRTLRVPVAVARDAGDGPDTIVIDIPIPLDDER